MSIKNPPFKLATTCQNQVTTFYQAQIKQQQQFLQLIREMLPTHLAEHLQYCLVSTKKCVLYTDAEEWAMQLRLYSPLILHTLQASRVTTLELIEVRLITTAAPPKASSVNIPSKQNIELLQENLQHIKDDELKGALSRLSQTLARLSS
jgi:hypothetical protein